MLARLLGSPWALVAVFVAGMAAGGAAVYQLWAVDSLERTVADQARDLADRDALIAVERENARRAAALAAARGKDAAEAQARAEAAEDRTSDILSEWADAAKRAAEEARAAGVDLARVCPGISARDWQRLQSEIPIGRPPGAARNPPAR